MNFTSHDSYINSNKSEKIILAHLHSSKRLYNFIYDSGSYSRIVDNFVSNVSCNSTLLTRVKTIGDLDSSSKYFYDVTTGKLHLYEFNQESDEVIVEFRFFLSNLPVILPWDLTDTGSKVNYEPRIETSPKFQSNMSQGKSGLNLVGKGDLIINNNDGFYDSIYDTLFWENKRVNIYSYSRHLVPSQAKIFFRGIITGKAFSTEKITFNLTDDLYSFEQDIPSSQYDDLVIEADSTNFKRVVYGRANNLQVQSLDKYGESGTPLSGTLKGVSGTSFITGVNTNFLEEVSNGDKILFDGFTVNVDEVKSNTIIRTGELNRTFAGLEASIIPEIQYSNKNREFQVCGHAIKKVSTTITGIRSRNRITVDSIDNFEAGDIIDINGEEKRIKRISSNTLVLTTNYNLDHSIGDTVTKKDIFNIRYDNNNKVDSADITVNNSSNGTTFTLSKNAEINSASTKTLQHKVNYINGSSGVWIGSPARHQISLATGDKFGTYFTIYDVEGASTAIWFKDTAPESSSAYQEPEHGADNSISISLLVNNPSISSLAEAIVNTINANIDHYYALIDGNSVIIESVNPEPISVPSAGTSGFSTSILTIGYTPEHKIDLSEVINPRDYIECPDGISREVLEVFEKSLKLRSDFQGTTNTYQLRYKNVNYIGDDSIVYVDCYGKTKDGTTTGELIKTGPEVVKDILDSIGLGSYLNNDSFLSASVRAPQLISLALPFTFDGAMPTVKEVINRVNKSILGSVFIDDELNLGYDILDSEIPLNTLETISDDDVIKWSVSGDSFDIVKKVVGNYRFIDYDPQAEQSNNSHVSHTSEFVSKYIGNENSKELNLYLYNESEARESVERDQFINSLSSTIIKVQGSLNLSKYTLGQRVLLDFKRLYVALGSQDSPLRVGVISSIKTNGEKVELEVMDLGSIYTRSARITDDSASDFNTSTNQERLLNSFITGDNGIIDENEETYSTNLIS